MLFMSKCHIVGNLMSRLKCHYRDTKDIQTLMDTNESIGLGFGLNRQWRPYTVILASSEYSD